ncbi:MAG: indolepyruvate ferredoxin oxidoreductase subunit alpha [Bacillota bacterium]
MHQIIAAKPGQRLLLMGNEAIARGALEGGVDLVAAYPGTPSSEITETLLDVAEDTGIYAEWSTNEKVAFEVAAGAAIAGVRSLVAMKNAGLNVAMDTFMTIPYGGIMGAMVVVVADDPGAHYSSTEQDTRVLARYAEIPCFEPRDQDEARAMTAAALELSAQLELPVFVRSVTRISHASGDVTLGHVPARSPDPGFNRHYGMPFRWGVYGPPGATSKHAWLHRTFPQQLAASEQSPFNVLTLKDGARVGIIAAGLGSAYAQDALTDLAIGENCHFLKLGLVNPLPEQQLKAIIRASQMLLVVEEGDPVVEQEVWALAKEHNPDAVIWGKWKQQAFLPYGELNGDLVRNAVARVFAQDLPACAARSEMKEKLRKLVVPRSSTLCAGCPHLGSFWALKMALRRFPGTHIVNGDIGCYEQGGYGIFGQAVKDGPERKQKQPIRSPYEILDTCHVMGSGIGLAQGQAQAGYREGKVLAVAGDSTFFHACLPALASAAWNNADITFLIMDNSWTAMTGHQPSPTTGNGQPVFDIPGLAEKLGAKIWQARAFDLEQATETIAQAVAHAGPSVVVLTGECALQYIRRERPGPGLTQVDPAACTGCKICLAVGCPAVTFDNTTKKAGIDAVQCIDCGLCVAACPQGAMSAGGEDHGS